MAAKNRKELLEVTSREYTKLKNILAKIDDQKAMLAQDGVSIKDVIGHRAHWIALFFGWYNDGIAGKEVYFPAKGYKWSDLKRYNAQLRKDQSGLDWAGAQKLLDANYNKLIDFIENHQDDEFYAGPMKGANNHWTTGRWAEAAGPSHFRSAAKFIRAVLRSVD